MKHISSQSILTTFGGVLMLCLASFFPSFADVSGAGGLGSGPKDGPEPTAVGKCCNPATKESPSAGCPAGRCTATPVCPAGSFEGSWDEGGCKNKKDMECEEDPWGDPFKPKYLCLPTLNCQQPDGSPGFKCQFVLDGETGNPAKNIKDCAGDPCP